MRIPVLFLCFAATLFADSTPAQAQDKSAGPAMPPAAMALITEYFPDSTIIKTKTDEDDNEFEVMLSGDFKLKFDLDGAWSSINVRNGALPGELLELLPGSIQTAIAKAGEPVKKIKRGSLGYEITRPTGIKFIYDKAGSLIDIED